MHQQGLFSGKSDLHRATQKPSGQGCVNLVRQVFFSAESPAIAHQFSGDNAGVDPENTRYVISIVPDSLTSGVDVKTVVGRDRES